MAPKGKGDNTLQLCKAWMEGVGVEEEAVVAVGAGSSSSGDGELPLMKKPAGLGGFAKKSLKKRPAAAEAEDPTVMKKPAGASPEDGSEDGGKRDKLKAMFVQRNMDELPTNIKEVLGSKARGSALLKTNLINSMCEKRNGRWEWTLDNQNVERNLQMYEEKFAQEKNVGIGKVMMRNRCGGQQQLDEAIKSGEVWVEEEDGVEWYFAKERSSGRRIGNKREEGVKSSGKIDSAKAKQIEDTLASMSFGFASSKVEAQRADASGKMPQGCLDKIEQAVVKAEKVFTELTKARKDMQTVSISGSALFSKTAGKLVEEMKVGMIDLKECSNKLGHMFRFNEMPGGEQLTVAGCKEELFSIANRIVSSFELVQRAKTCFKSWRSEGE